MKKFLALFMTLILVCGSISISVDEVYATRNPPAGCSTTTGRPHTTDGGATIRVHGVTNCLSYKQGQVQNAYVSTRLYQVGVGQVGSGSKSGLNYAESSAQRSCRAGQYYATSYHSGTYNGLPFGKTSQSGTFWLSCPYSPAVQPTS